MEPEKIYNIDEIAAMYFPKRHSEDYWYRHIDPYIRNYITGRDGLSLSGIGRFGLNRARNEYMSLGNTFRRKSLSAPEMAKYENKYRIDQSLFDVARDEIESEYNADAEKHQSGKMSGRRWNRKSQRYEQQMKNLNENQYILDQQQHPFNYVQVHKPGDIAPALFSIGFPLMMIGALKAAPYIPWIAKNIALPVLGGEVANNITRNISDGYYNSFGDFVYRSTPLEKVTKDTKFEEPAKFVAELTNPGYLAPYAKITKSLFGNLPTWVNNKIYGISGNMLGYQMYNNPISSDISSQMIRSVPRQYQESFARGIQNGTDFAESVFQKMNKSANASIEIPIETVSTHTPVQNSMGLHMWTPPQAYVDFGKWATPPYQVPSGIMIKDSYPQLTFSIPETNQNLTNDFIQFVRSYPVSSRFKLDYDKNFVQKIYNSFGLGELPEDVLLKSQLIARESARKTALTAPELTLAEMKYPYQREFNYYRDGKLEGTMATRYQDYVDSNGQVFPASHINVITKWSEKPKGVGRKLYSAGLRFDDLFYKQVNPNSRGLISGEHWMSPEQSLPTIMKPEFTTIPFGQYGTRTYNSGEFINPTGVRESVSNAPVYNLINTSDHIPVKSDNILHPDRIKFEDGKWKLLPLNLKDSSLYKVLFPITSAGLIGGTAISDNE